MIDPITLKKIARLSRMDSFTILREYLQIVLLNTIFQLSPNHQLVFKGGTALRLFYGSPRFSEDLDFNTNLSRITIQKLLSKVLTEAKKVIPQIYFKELNSIVGFSAKVYLPTPMAPMPLTIKLDFSEREKTMQIIQNTISTTLPISSFSLIHVMSEEEILAEKLRTIFQRKKGRDVYDIWYLLNKRVSINSELVTSKFRLIKQKYDQDQVLKQISSFKIAQLKKDLYMFLPQDQRQLVTKIPAIICDRLSHP